MAIALTLKPVALSPDVARTLRDTLITLAGMAGITAVAAGLSLGLQLSMFGMLSLFILSVFLLILLRAYQTSHLGLLILATYSVVSGVILGPALNYFLSLPQGPALVASAAGLTALACLVCAGIVMVTGNSFSSMRTYLVAATVVLLVGYLVSWFIVLPMMAMGLTIAGVVIFTGWLLHDLGQVISGQQTNYMVAATGIYLSVLNLFVSLLRLIGYFSQE